MENALYYTLSTIAQTLAAALAVLVAFVLFRLSALDRRIDLAKDILRRRSLGLPYEQTWPVLRDQGMRALVGFLTNQEQPAPLHHSEERACDAAHAAYQTWGVILHRLYTTLTVTVVAIAFCFVALSFTRHIVWSPFATHVLAASVALGIVCLFLYVWLIAAMVRRPAD
jgi:hypothetical protein